MTGGGRGIPCQINQTPAACRTCRKVGAGPPSIRSATFRDYAAGLSPKRIAKDLNQEGFRGPRGALWSPSTIHGNPKRGVGILHNEL